MNLISYSTQENIPDRKTYEEIIERDRGKLLMNQFRLRDAGVPVIVLLSGTQTSGYTRVVNLLNEWMDTRFVETHVYSPPSDEEADRPFFWKYWRQFPASGKTGLFLGGWYTEVFLDKLNGSCAGLCYQSRLKAISEMEQLLAVDGALIIKIWLHLEKNEKRENKNSLQNNRPENTWQVTMDDWQNGNSYEEKTGLVREIIRDTNKPYAPWVSVSAADTAVCDISVMHLLTKTFQQHLDRIDSDNNKSSSPYTPSLPDYMQQVDLSKSLDRKSYLKQMNNFWESIYVKSWKMHQQKKSVVIVLEGSDAAGKGGAIRRLIRCLDARLYRVLQVAAPTKEEKSRHYLWRFWMQIPRAGFITIYDRSWYGRVLVERVEGFASDAEWQRAYEEINHFEKQLTDAGTAVVKFWLQISKKEQKKRFKKREKTDYKQFKLTDEDWRNREKWDKYEKAVNDMLAFTNTAEAPWNVIPAEDKKYARIAVLKTLDNVLDEKNKDAEDKN